MSQAVVHVRKVKDHKDTYFVEIGLPITLTYVVQGKDPASVKQTCREISEEFVCQIEQGLPEKVLKEVRKAQMAEMAEEGDE